MYYVGNCSYDHTVGHGTVNLLRGFEILCSSFVVNFHSKLIFTLDKKVTKAFESRTLLRYSITYHYDHISLSTSDANEKISCIRR